MAKNENLHKAKDAKNDEFYTLLSSVSEELRHYKQHFADKIVFCNCDDPTWSAFWRYFHLNFSELGLKKLIATHYDRTEPTYKMEYEGGDDNDAEVGVKTPLEGNGDFRSEECLALLDECDIVVTNPPFSLFREFVGTLMKHDKRFIIWGNNNAITYKEFFPLLKENKVWLGYTANKTCTFRVAEGYRFDEKLTAQFNDGHKYGKVPAISVFTNLDIQKRHEKLILWQRYYDDDGNPLPDVEERYPRYDNYMAINVDRVANIPVDYEGVMGVPITFLDKYNPEQFEIVGGSMFDDTPCRADKDYTSLGFKFFKADGITISGSGALRDKMSPKVVKRGRSDFSVSPDGVQLSAVYQRIFIRKRRKQGDEGTK